MNLMKFKIDAVSNGGMKTEIDTGKFKIIVDEPKNIGGIDEGLTPVDLVLAGLVNCYIVVGNMAARELDLERGGDRSKLEGTLNPARFAGKSYDDRAGFKDIQVKIKVDTDADEQTLKQWIEMVEKRCLVTDNLTNETTISIILD